MPEKPPSPAPPSKPESPSPSTAVARLLRPQGRRGELLADPLTDLPDIFVAGRQVSLPATATAAPLATTLESSWTPTGRNAGRVVLKLAGIDSISAAELLAGRELHIPSTDLPPLEADTWFVRDLVGCLLLDGERPVGEITGVEYAMAPDGRTRLPDAAPLLEVSLPKAPDEEADPEPLLIPFIKAWLDSVDLPARRVTMQLPPGLVDLNAS